MSCFTYILISGPIDFSSFFQCTTDLCKSCLLLLLSRNVQELVAAIKWIFVLNECSFETPQTYFTYHYKLKVAGGSLTSAAPLYIWELELVKNDYSTGSVWKINCCRCPGKGIGRGGFLQSIDLDKSRRSHKRRMSFTLFFVFLWMINIRSPIFHYLIVLSSKNMVHDISVIWSQKPNMDLLLYNMWKHFVGSIFFRCSLTFRLCRISFISSLLP